MAQAFSCEFCKISQNAFFHRTLLVAASEFWLTENNLLVGFVKSIFGISLLR